MQTDPPPFWYLFHKALIAPNEVGTQVLGAGISTPRTRQESREESGSLSLVRGVLSVKEDQDLGPGTAGK